MIGAQVKRFVFFEKYAYQKPFCHHELVEKCFNESYTLSVLGMSPFEAEKEGFVRVTNHTKQRPARWTLKKHIKNFEAADEYLEVMEGESERILGDLKNGKYFDDKLVLKKIFEEKLGEGFNEKALFEDLDRVRYYYDAVSEKVSSFVSSAEQLTCLNSDIIDEYLNFKNELIDKKESFFEPLDNEIKESTKALEETISLLVEKTADQKLREEFFDVAEQEGLILSHETIVDEFALFIMTITNAAGHIRRTKLHEAKKHFKKLHKKMNLDTISRELNKLQNIAPQWLEKEFIVSYSKRKKAKDLWGLKLPDLFELSLENNINRKSIQDKLEDVFPRLDSGSDFSYSSEIKIRELSFSEHMISYKFKFSNLVGNYSGNLSGRYEWPIDSESKLVESRKDKGLLTCSEMFLSQVIFLQNIHTFSLSKDFISRDSLLNKNEKFVASMEFFIAKNFEKAGFDDFCKRKGTFSCKSLKQAKNFSSYLEKSFADFSLARLATSYADIFSVRSNERIRNVIYYSGPTNSGKSYRAFEELAKHETGVYLGPLRLLALEGVEELTKRGRKTNLVTGEERELVDGATHSSQTIETYDREKQVDCAIIDEIQLIADKGRGGAFMEALLNINADTLVLTGSHDAVGIVKEICEKTGDLFSNVKLERKNPLKWVGNFKIADEPCENMKGTAIVAFSKKSIHNIRNFLLNKGYSVSVIYGALSPDVRRAEAERFRKGETDILVATDAIGLGLNLPIKRVLFSQSDKFDGEQVRDLTPTEILQIGGRAGRFGMFQENGEVGFVEGLSRFEPDEWVLKNGFYKTLKKLKNVYVSITYRQLSESYLSLDKGLSQIIKTLMAKNSYSWSRAKPADVVDNERYMKSLIIENAAETMATYLDMPGANGAKVLRKLDVSFVILFRLLNTPFDADLNEELLLKSFSNVLRSVAGMDVVKEEIVNFVADVSGSHQLEDAEAFVKELTLHYYFATFFLSLDHYPYNISPVEILELRKKVGLTIAEYLAKNESVEGFSTGKLRRKTKGRGKMRGRRKKY